MDIPYISTSEAAKRLGISRIAVFKRIKNGSLKAVKVGRNYVVDVTQNASLSEMSLSPTIRKELDAAVKKTVHEYGEALKRLGAE